MRLRNESGKKFMSTLVLALLATGQAVAADAGSEIRRLQDETRRILQQPSRDKVPPTELPPSRSKAAAEASSTQTHVSGFQVHGVTQFSQAAVAESLKAYVGRTLSTADIHAAAQSLQQKYRAAGYFAAKVFIPPQTFGEIIQLDVEEGYLEENGIEVINKGRRVESSVVQDIVSRYVVSDRPLRSEDVERALLIAEDLPGVGVASVLYPGQAVGTARLRVQMTDEPGFAGNVDVDNFGNDLTGRERLGTTLYLNSPSSVGDQAVARLVTSGERSNYAYLTYLRPISSSGSRVGASIDYFDYHAGSIAGLGNAEGYASDARLYLTHPVVRSRHTNVNLHLDFSHQRLSDRNEVAINAERHLNLVTIALTGDKTHDWLGKGISLFDTSLTAGRLELDGNDAYRVVDANGPKISGDFARFNFTLQHLQPISGPWSFYGKLAGQLASTNLGNSQKYYLGGGTSLSGYPVGEAGGDQAVEIHAEARREFVPPWGGNIHGSVFYEQAWLQQHKTTWAGWQGANTSQSNNISLKTLGLGFTQSWANTWLVRGLIGWQIDGNPLKNTQTGAASDGSSDKYRAWFQVVRYF